jgi:hypothetical protein
MAQILAGGSEPNAGGNTEVITQVQTATWTQLQGKPYIEVSSKGIVNGLSSVINDGADFGPDTTKGATAPGQYGSPYTKSTGIGDAINYALANPYKDANGSPIPQKVHILSGAFYIYDPITVQSSTSYVSLLITGDSSTQTWIYSAHNSGYTITINPSNFANASIEFDNMAPAPMSGYTPEGFLYMDFTTTNNGSNTFQSYNLDVAGRGYSDNSIYTTGLENIFLYNFEDYGTNDTFGISNNVETGGIYWYGGYVPYTLTFIGTGTLSADNPMKLYMSANGFISTLNIGNFNTAVFEQVYFSNNAGINLTGDINSMTFVGGNLQCAIILDSSLSTSPTVDSLYVLGTQLYLTNNFTVNHNVTLTYWDLKWGGVVTNGYTFIPTSPSPSISTNPPVSGTAYQNTNPYDIRLKIPVTYSPTSSAAATLATGTSSSSTVTTSTKVSYPAGITTGIINTYEMVVPAGHYFELVVTNATIGTAEVQVA